MRFDLQNGFPLVTTKKLHLKSIIYELLWFLKGDTNVKYLQENGVRIWDEWADENGNLGPVYGKQWRSWAGANGETFDQVSDLITQLKTNPDSRRLIISAWNVADLPEMKLMPCHCLVQFYTAPTGRNGEKKIIMSVISKKCRCFFRSTFQYCFLCFTYMMIAQVCDMEPGEFVHSFGDVHLYKNHFEQAQLQLPRKPFPPPQMKLNPEVKNIFDFEFEDFELQNYEAHPSIKAPVAVYATGTKYFVTYKILIHAFTYCSCFRK